MKRLTIYIDRTIGIRCKKEGLTQEEELFFGQLVAAHQRGECLLCGHLDSLEWLGKCLSGPQAKLYKEVYAKYSETRAIIGCVGAVLVITDGIEPIIPTFIEGKQRTLNLKEAMEKDITSKCYLVGENLNDCVFYTVMAKRYLHKLPIRAVQVNFSNENGGGDTINLVYKKCVSTDKRLTFCIADSDKKHGKSKEYPNEPARGETIRKLEKVHEELVRSQLDTICEVLCLPVHEVENLIPISVLQLICDSGVPEMAEGISFIKRLLAHNMGEAVLYYDFKQGDKKIKDLPCIAYWLEVLEESQGSEMSGLCSTKLLEKALSIMKDDSGEITTLTANMTIDPYLSQFWRGIGYKVFSWGCCNNPARS